MITNPEHTTGEFCEPKKTTNDPVTLAVSVHLQYDVDVAVSCSLFCAASFSLKDLCASVSRRSASLRYPDAAKCS